MATTTIDILIDGEVPVIKTIDIDTGEVLYELELPDQNVDPINFSEELNEFLSGFNVITG